MNKRNLLCVLTGSFAEAEDMAVVKSFVEATVFSSLFSCKHTGHGSEREGGRAWTMYAEMKTKLHDVMR